jgi:cytochrome P450
MFRQAAQDIELSDGSVIPKGAFTLVANFRMWDSDVYPNPNTFDPYRFLRLREAGDSSAYLVSPSPEHMGFSYGNHACPGRFFAANEVKILLAHMILKYDIQLVDGCTPTVLKVGIGLVADPTAKLAIRRRQEEIPLDIEASTNK